MGSDHIIAKVINGIMLITESINGLRLTAREVRNGLRLIG